MADDFVNRLRMNSIFPTAGFNPLQPPERPSFDMNGLINTIAALQHNARSEDMAQEDNMHRRGQFENLQNIARQNAMQKLAQENSPLRAQGGMNVVLGGGQTPAKLNGETLDQAEAKRTDPYFKDSVAPDYIREEDKPGSQESLLARDAQKIKGQTTVASTKAQADFLKQQAKDAETEKRDKEKQANAVSNINLRDKNSRDAITIRDRNAQNMVDVKEAATEKMQKDKEDRATEVRNKQTSDMAKDTLDSLNDLVDTKTGELKPEITGAVGASRFVGDLSRGQLPPWVPGSEAMTADTKLKNFSSKTILNLVAQLKSPNGTSAFPRMTNQDLNVITSAANKLNSKMNEADYAKELMKIRTILIKHIQPEVSRSPAGPANNDPLGIR